jgi:tRNA/rRNA methyltransferase
VSARVSVVLVRPKEDGNVGAVARVARNFGADELVIVDPRASLGPEAKRRAMGGGAILAAAKVVDEFGEAVARADLVVGTTDLSTGRSASYLRRAVPPERLGELLRPLEGTVAIVFGPEDNGLGREELARCDLLVHIPARREFPTLNLSHAAAIVLYSVLRARGPADPETTPAPETLLLNGHEKEILLERVEELAAKAGYPKHKRHGLGLLWRRVLGRSTPTEAEYRMLLGFFKSVNRWAEKSHGGR